jgi:hypothetical protein
MDNDITSISANNELSFYTDKNNIPNQDLVKETIDYFESGQGARAFKPLYFLNLLERQFQFMKDNIKDGETVIQHIRNLPLNNLEQHILCGFLLKWSGGYPVNNFNEDFNNTLKQIQVEFLGYNENTPEKEFCKANPETRKKFMMMGIALTNAINNNVSASAIMNAMPGKKPSTKVYDSFDALYKDAATSGTFGEFGSKEDFVINQSVYNFKFNEWLLEQKDWEYGNEEEYNKFLTKSFLIEFLNYNKVNIENTLGTIPDDLNFESTKPITNSDQSQMKSEGALLDEQHSDKGIPITPLQYLNFQKSAFFSNLTKQNNFTLEDAEKLYLILLDSIKHLEQTRNDALLSKDFIKEKLKELYVNPTFDKVPNMWLHWLVESLKHDDSYVYAFNYLAQETYRRTGTAFYHIKIVSDFNLYKMLEKEKAQNHKTAPITTLSEQPQTVKIPEVLTLKDYKKKLDLTLEYYSEFNKILIAINRNDEQLLIQSILHLKAIQDECLESEPFLTEQVHFDLNNEELKKYYKYAIIKFDEIIRIFNFNAITTDNITDDDFRNSSMQKLWHTYSNITDFLIINYPTHKHFIWFLTRALERFLNEYYKRFRKSYSMSFSENESSAELENIIENSQNPIHKSLNRSISSLTDTNQIISNLLLLFEKFDTLNFIVTDERKKEINLDVLTYDYSEDIHVLKKQILVLHLNSNTVLLDKVKSELIKMRNTLIGMDFGLMPHVSHSEKTKVLTDPDPLKMINDSQRLCVTELIDYIDSFENLQPSPPVIDKTETVNPELIIKPVFNSEAIPSIFDILKDYFSLPHQVYLKQILETGNDASEQLIFLDNGNRLADAFKQLKDSDIITGCKKTELIDWIHRNFLFRNGKLVTKYKTRYLADIISTDKDKCQKPLLNVSKDKTISKA